MRRPRRLNNERGSLLFESALCLSLMTFLLIGALDLMVAGWQQMTLQRVCDLTVREMAVTSDPLSSVTARVRTLANEFGLPGNNIQVTWNTLNATDTSGDYFICKAQMPHNFFWLERASPFVLKAMSHVQIE